MNSYYVNYYSEMVKFARNYEEHGSVTDISVNGAIICAENRNKARDIFLIREYRKHPIPLQKLYMMFLEDFCFYYEHSEDTGELKALFGCSKWLLDIKQRMDFVKEYQIGFEEEVGDQLTKLCPYNEFVRALSDEADMEQLFAYINRHKTAALP